MTPITFLVWAVAAVFALDGLVFIAITGGTGAIGDSLGSQMAEDPCAGGRRHTSDRASRPEDAEDPLMGRGLRPGLATRLQSAHHRLARNPPSECGHRRVPQRPRRRSAGRVNSGGRLCNRPTTERGLRNGRAIGRLACLRHFRTAGGSRRPIGRRQTFGRQHNAGAKPREIKLGYTRGRPGDRRHAVVAGGRPVRPGARGTARTHAHRASSSLVWPRGDRGKRRCGVKC
jgi:hypothetical protein